jgi:hypothetical protein
MEKRVTTVEIAGKLLDVSRGVAYESARTGALPTVKLGRRIVVPLARLGALLGETPESLNAAIQAIEAGNPSRSLHADVA